MPVIAEYEFGLSPNVYNNAFDVTAFDNKTVQPAGPRSGQSGMVQQLYQQSIRRRLAELFDHEQVRKFTLIDRAFSSESDELTPKLSLRRKVIETNFAEQIEAMYRE